MEITNLKQFNIEDILLKVKNKIDNRVSKYGLLDDSVASCDHEIDCTLMEEIRNVVRDLKQDKEWEINDATESEDIVITDLFEVLLPLARKAYENKYMYKKI